MLNDNYMDDNAISLCELWSNAFFLTCVHFHDYYADALTSNLELDTFYD